MADHLNKDNIKCALITTVGFVGKPSTKAGKVFMATKLFAALAESGLWMNDLALFVTRHEPIQLAPFGMV